jgi:ribokinase
MHNRVVVVGSYNTDMVVRTSRIPRPGETVIGGSFTSGHGGKGANQAVAAARAGAQVTFIGKIGTDALGDEAAAGLRAEGIDTRFLVRDPAHATGTAWIIVDERGENSIVVASGANAALVPEDIARAAEAIVNADVLLLQLECPVPAVRAAIDIATANGVRVILNPAPACSLDHELLRSVSILTPNEVEAEMLTGIPVDDDLQLNAAVGVLLERGVGTVIVTLGARGVHCASAAGREAITSFPVTPIDTTAAGDVFNGVLAAFLSKGRPLHEAVLAANAAGALCVTRHGAQQSVPTLPEILSFMETAVPQPH